MLAPWYIYLAIAVPIHAIAFFVVDRPSTLLRISPGAGSTVYLRQSLSTIASLYPYPLLNGLDSSRFVFYISASAGFLAASLKQVILGCWDLWHEQTSGFLHLLVAEMTLCAAYVNAVACLTECMAYLESQEWIRVRAAMEKEMADQAVEQIVLEMLEDWERGTLFSGRPT